VSVCGTDYITLCLENFLGSALCCINLGRTLNFFAPLEFLIKERFRDLPRNHPYGTNQNPIIGATYCTPSTHRMLYKSWNINHCSPSRAAFAIRLGPTNPSLTIIEKETLVFRRAGFSPALWLLVPTFLLPNAPPWVTPSASLRLEYSPTTSRPRRVATSSVSVHNLSPDYLRRRFS